MKDWNSEILHTYHWLLKETRAYENETELKLLRSVYQGYIQCIADLEEKEIEDWIKYPTEIARIILYDIGLGATSLCSVLLYVLYQREIISRDEVKALYPEKVFEIFDGLIRLSSINTSKVTHHSDRFVKLLITSTDDFRIILLKLAERLLRMRQLEGAAEEIQIIVSDEIYYLYAPMAHRLGFYKIKQEIEDLYLKYREQELYEDIVRKLSESEAKRTAFIDASVEPIKEALDELGLNYEIKWRTKSVHSILRKIQQKRVEFEEVYDLFAVRIIINSSRETEIEDCWRVYSVVTNMYEPNPARLRDWISLPKNTGYESLHTTVLGPGKKWFEVQIRSRRMDDIAEKGLAAHWKYKGGRSEKEFEELLQTFREVLENPETTSLDFVEKPENRIEFNEIFCFTPKGDLKKLVQGATVLDFAFQIHTRVGASCVSAKVNKKLVPIKHVLSNGDQVEIITSKNQQPNEGWLKIVKSPRVKARIKRYLAEKEHQNAEIGKQALIRKLKSWKLEYDDDIVHQLVKALKLKNAIELYAGLANEKYSYGRIRDILTQETEDRDMERPAAKHKEASDHEEADGNVLVIDEHLDHVNFRLAKCCSPIRGDAVVGFITIGKGISIHRQNCPNLKHSVNKYPYRKVAAKWNESAEDNAFQVKLRVTGTDELGILNKITETLASDLKVNIRALQINSSGGMFDSTVQVSIASIAQLDMVIQKLLKIKAVKSVVRQG